MAFNDRELLARMIQCEAGGEGEIGMKAVATVIMNRVHACCGEYSRVCKGDLHRVVFQTNQFNCATTILNGNINTQNIYNMSPEDIHYQIADWALSGGVLTDVGDSLWFYNPYCPNCRDYFPSKTGIYHTRINSHCFYRPTADYYYT